MKTLKLAALSLALVAAVSTTSFAQVAGRGGRGGGGAAMGGAAPLGPISQAAAAVSAPRNLATLFVGTAAINDSATLAKAVAINAKYQPTMQLGRVTRAGPPADSLAAKARVATADRNKELKDLLKSDEDKKKFDENVVAQTAGRGGN
jgi:hypothetical protein